ncbi:hypothetical protein [Burkholderia ubonensis]|uniref:hypothetical protein n=1 Tax=Burkholderia ubonensis TaxID=101571 RepID=UPI000A3DB0F8|nr:hypothetical protein [Burkholderia ubonensis]
MPASSALPERNVSVDARALVQFEVGQAAQRVGAERDEWHQNHGDHDADDGRSFQLFALGSAA